MAVHLAQHWWDLTSPKHFQVNGDITKVSEIQNNLYCLPGEEVRNQPLFLRKKGISFVHAAYFLAIDD